MPAATAPPPSSQGVRPASQPRPLGPPWASKCWSPPLLLLQRGGGKVCGLGSSSLRGAWQLAWGNTLIQYTRVHTCIYRGEKLRGGASRVGRTLIHWFRPLTQGSPDPIWQLSSSPALTCRFLGMAIGQGATHLDPQVAAASRFHAVARITATFFSNRCSFSSGQTAKREYHSPRAYRSHKSRTAVGCLIRDSLAFRKKPYTHRDLRILMALNIKAAPKGG